MIFSVKSVSRLRQHPLADNSDRGAITVEYALTMIVAAFLMSGMDVMFYDLARDVVGQFMYFVKNYP